MAISSFLDKVLRRQRKIKKSPKFMGIFEFDFKTIRDATRGFMNSAGRSYFCFYSFGSVYKGRLQSGQQIAVKRFCESTIREFHNEINVLSKLRHKNVINLLGFSFCSEQEEHFLIYDLMPNSSLDLFILPKAAQTSWETYRNIIQGIAQGLRYLHEESGLLIVHCDIQPKNILLDADFKPKIKGFKLARIMQEGENEVESSPLAGTIGDIAPDNIQPLYFSDKSDVYAFGVTILRIISRRRPFGDGDEGRIKYAMRCWNSGKSIEVIYEDMRYVEKEDSISEIFRYIHIALLCVHDNPEARPSLDKVLHWFSCSYTPLPEPTIANRYLAEEETNSST